MPERIDLSERLFNLTCALLVAGNGLSKAEIFATVQGYKEIFDPVGDNSALNRMFERDKVQLTEAGVAWRSFIPKEAMEDNQEFRYLIANEDFVWPKGVKLSSKQVALLNLAAQVWAKASLSADANRALHRIRAMGDSAASSTLIGIAPRIRTHDPAFLPLSTAIETNSRVSFDYLKPGDEEPSVRNLEPWSLQNIGGQWLLIAYDLDRDQPRNFLLRRIVSDVDIQDVSFDPPQSDEVALALQDLESHKANQLARIRVKPNSAAWFHFDLKSDELEFETNYMDLSLFAEELMEFVDEVEIIKPLELEQLLRANLLKVKKVHA
jgi:proteasome accessory factor B